MVGSIYELQHKQWQVPDFRCLEFNKKRSDVCVCIPVINEGQRIKSLIGRMSHLVNTVDVLIADGGSTDGSVEEDYLRKSGVCTLLTKEGPGKLSAQLRMAMAYAIEQGYTGIVTIDGNNKDDPEAIPEFLSKLKEGYDFIQGSRYMPGGKGLNTPFIRHMAIKFLHVPLISLSARYRYTDTTCGFRAYNTQFLLDKRIQPFRNVFWSYELLFYLAVCATRLGFRVTEIPTTRSYPANNKIPTKISFVRGNINLLMILLKTLFVGYYP